ncbi:diaminopimelate epimerase [Longibacter salinarum]|uniref:Diaminopimelate epimerase n=1 Tax=Longibacter salinarum TaxID=1850348 RepID=A0A2A8D261_9BACT|nr:diaminopimelate epimerase [Longibacter salinarum]PEN14971.1 diaminopimelate epimerase [Longibacter salinarum]
MSRKLVVEFTKMEGAGNDFIVLDNRFLHFTADELSDIADRFCPRRFGIGADGLLAFEDDDDADFRMRYINADGSPATMCGNGARCIARLAVAAGIDGPDVTFATDAGMYRAHVPVDATKPVRLFVPEPREWQEHVSLDQSLPDGIDTVHYIWTGTEHLVVPVRDAGAAPLAVWGPRLRKDPALQPEGANVNVVAEGKDVHSITVRTFEKGVEAETLACGTGVIASAIATSRLRGEDDLATHPVTVHAEGGTLRVGRADTFDRAGHLYLEGPARSVFRGTFEWGGEER